MRSRYPAVFVAALAATGLFALAGPLDPPVGPISSTLKPLSEIEPRVAINSTNTPGDAVSQFLIEKPGSYYLAANVLGVPGKSGIRITADNVSIDLMDFTLQGVTGSLNAVFLDGSGKSIRVRNGIVTQWGGKGIGTQNCTASVENIQALNNGDDGINTGSNSIVRSCVASGNSGTGISVSTGSAVTECTASSNKGDGIFANGRSTVTACVAEGNTLSGLSGVFGASFVDCTSGSNGGFGISLHAGCMASGCYVSTNGADGIFTDNDGVVSKNACHGNGAGATNGAGIFVTNADNLIEGNNCTDNDTGVRVTSSGNFVTRNTCSGNTIRNWDIAASNKCLVVLGVNAAAISGDFGGASPGSTDPNANYSY